MIQKSYSERHFNGLQCVKWSKKTYKRFKVIYIHSEIPQMVKRKSRRSRSNTKGPGVRIRLLAREFRKKLLNKKVKIDLEQSISMETINKFPEKKTIRFALFSKLQWYTL